MRFRAAARKLSFGKWKLNASGLHSGRRRDRLREPSYWCDLLSIKRDRLRTSHQEALKLITAHLAKQIDLLLGFDAFCNDWKAQAMAQPDHSLHDGR